MEEQFSRTGLLLGEEALLRLQQSRVAVFGIGGVGGYTVEALARAGVGTIDVIDSDTVSISNLNRQLLATYDTVGMLKVEAAKARILSINPRAAVYTHRSFIHRKRRINWILHNMIISLMPSIPSPASCASFSELWRLG